MDSFVVHQKRWSFIVYEELILIA